MKCIVPRPAIALSLLLCGSLLVESPRAGAADSPAVRPDDIVLTFKGQIDGSDQITITESRATWNHTHWNLPPAPVSFNGISWNPSESLILENTGNTWFLPRPVDFASARLIRREVRGIVALECRSDSVVIHLSDSLEGAGLYEFQVVFRPHGKAPTPSVRRTSPRATLHIVADIDGSDELHIDPRGARWVHREWGWPTEVRLNDVSWSPEDNPALPNDGETRFLRGDVDFTTARLTRQEGRDTAVLERTDGGIVIYFGDSPLARSKYDVTVTFGP